jgi:carbon-monoxide dehydrogenase medium subunit
MRSIAISAPRDVPELASVVSGSSGDIAFIAGGTDMVMTLARGASPDVLIDISQLRELSFVAVEADRTRIGAATTFSDLAGDVHVAECFPALAQASMQAGSVQIRNRATIGGNIASAMPAGDLLPVLKCLDARIHVLTRQGETRSYAFDAVVRGAGRTTLPNGYLITEISLPRAPRDGRTSAFAKLGRRDALTIARLNLAASVEYDEASGRLGEVRLTAGAIGPVPARLSSVERVLAGRRMDARLACDFACALSAAVDEAIAGRPSHPYKRGAVAGVGLDLLERLFGRAFDFAAREALRP